MKYKNVFGERAVLGVAFCMLAAVAPVSTAVADDVVTGNSAVVVPSGIADLTGKNVDFANYQNLISEGKPTDDETRQFLLYNIGTGKFLNLGGYWGTHAALSDVPRKYWFQNHNDKTVRNYKSYLRYPDTEYDRTSFNSFFSLSGSEMQVGNKEGTRPRGNAVYNYLRLRNKKTNETINILPEGTASNEFMTTMSQLVSDFSFDRYDIEAQIDMTGVTCAKGAEETLLSFGSDVAVWATSYNPVVAPPNLHFYGYENNGNKVIVVQALENGYNDKTNKSGTSDNPIAIGSDNLVTVVIKSNSIVVNNVQCMPRTNGSATKAVAPLLAKTSVSVGNTLGDSQSDKPSHANYISVNCLKAERTETKDNEVLAPGTYYATDRTFGKDFATGIVGKEVSAEIDLSTCKSGLNENIFSVGTDITAWSANGENIIHTYYNGSALTVYTLTYVDGNEVKATYTYNKESQFDATQPLNISVSDDGMFVNKLQVLAADDAVLKAIMNTTGNVSVGSREGVNRSHATYNKFEVNDCDHTYADNLLPTAGTTHDGSRFLKKYVGSLGDKEIEVVMDLSTCDTSKAENVLSIGNNILAWANTGNYNIHIYYNLNYDPKKADGPFEIDFLYKQGSLQQAQVFPAIPTNNVMTLKFNKDGLYVNGTLMASSSNQSVIDAVMKYFNNSATVIEVGSAEGASGSHATYTTFSVTGTGVRAQSAPRLRKALARAEESGMTTETIVANHTDGTSFSQTIDDIDFSIGDRIEAEIDLSPCTDNDEAYATVLSIGTNIGEWGYVANDKNDTQNLHIRYLTTKDKEYVMQAAVVNSSHEYDLKYRFTVPVGTTMKVVFSSKGLYINDTEIYPEKSLSVTVPYVADKKGTKAYFKADEYGNMLPDAQGNFAYTLAGDNDAYRFPIVSSANGYIYTNDNFADEVMPMFITSRFEQESTISSNEDSYLAWAPYLSDNNKYGNIGLFSDRALPTQNAVKNEAYDDDVEHSQWYFKKVNYTQKNGAVQNVYKIYLRMTDTQYAKKNGNRPSTGDPGYTIETYSGTRNFYLQATPENIYGENMQNYKGTFSEMTSTDTKDYVSADVVPTDDEDTDAEFDPGVNGYWKVIDIQEYYQLFNNPSTELSTMLDLTFKMSDPDFTRESPELKNWLMDSSLEGKVRIGFDEYSKKLPSDSDYKDDQGKKDLTKWNSSTQKSEVQELGNWNYYTINSRRGIYARYMGVDVRNAGGRFYQEVELDYPGWYSFSCSGMTDAGAKLFVQRNVSGAVAVTKQLPNLSQADKEFFMGRQMKWPFSEVVWDGTAAQGMPMYNALVAMNDDNITLADNGMDNRVDDFKTSLSFFVDPVALADAGGKMSFLVGVDIPETTMAQQLPAVLADATTTADEVTRQDPVQALYLDTPWTVFDNFHLMFGGLAKEPNLMLNEENTNLNYIDDASHVFSDRPMRLYRTFRGNSWNTIILPVNLTKTQFETAFGETAKLAKLKELKENTIEFESETEDDGIYLKAFKPYVIWVDSEHSKGTEGKYTGTLYTRSSGGSTYNTYDVPENHFKIDDVTLQHLYTGDDQQPYYNFAADTKADSYVVVDEGKASYTYKDDVLATLGTDATTGLRAYGTLCKTYEDNTIIDGRPTLKGSFVMSSQNLHLITNENGYGTKGFRCWFTPEGENAEQLATKLNVYFDGISDPTLDIVNINDDVKPIEGKYAKGVFTIGGERMSEGVSLPAGVYIVNGKKQIVTRK